MGDVKDILGVPREGTGGGAAPAPAAKKPAAKRPEGMSREAFALLGGSHPVVPAHLLDELGKGAGKKKDDGKKQRASKGRVVFRYKPFFNQARADGLMLKHWAKAHRDALGRERAADDGADYPFAKYNRRCTVYRYDDEEWKNVVSDPPPPRSRRPGPARRPTTSWTCASSTTCASW